MSKQSNRENKDPTTDSHSHRHPDADSYCDGYHAALRDAVQYSPPAIPELDTATYIDRLAYDGG